MTRLRVLRRGWGRFTAEEVTIAVLDLSEGLSGRDLLDLDETSDLDDGDAETGLPRGRERPN